MDQKPRLTISGYRGIWGKDLDEQITFEYALAFATLVKQSGGQKIIIGRDARKTGPLMLSAILSACQKAGIEAEDAGILPTPSLLLAVRKLSLDGGIIITASHNPSEYNGLKFVMSDALFAKTEDIAKIEEIKNGLNEKYVSTEIKEPPDNKKFRDIHISEILKNVDADLIRGKKFKVALDPINSAGSVITCELLEELGCETYIINEEQTGEFTHAPEPLVENLGEISEAVKNHSADIGFAQDPDADRLVVVTESGEILSEEYTLALAIKNVLAKNPSDIVVNMSTSNLSSHIANQYNKKTYRTKIGEANVVEKIKELGASIGGEGNGGVIYPAINTARDSLVGIALILELMAKENKKMSEIVYKFPKYIMTKDKLPFHGDKEELYVGLKKLYSDAALDETDGLRFDWPDGSWQHIRVSNTEPIIRIITEGITINQVKSLNSKAMLTLGAI